MPKRVKKPTVLQMIMVEVESRLKVITYDSKWTEYLPYA